MQPTNFKGSMFHRHTEVGQLKEGVQYTTA